MTHGPNGEDQYLINNNMTPYLARFIMDRVPDLQGFFETRELGQRQKTRAIVVLSVDKQQKEKSA